MSETCHAHHGQQVSLRADMRTHYDPAQLPVRSGVKEKSQTQRLASRKQPRNLRLDSHAIYLAPLCFRLNRLLHARPHQISLMWRSVGWSDSQSVSVDMEIRERELQSRSLSPSTYLGASFAPPSVDTKCSIKRQASGSKCCTSSRALHWLAAKAYAMMDESRLLWQANGRPASQPGPDTRCSSCSSVSVRLLTRCMAG
ncbi:hypothetical protein BC567DRAFT_232729 [Phyllosticta citribraziliensis]